MNKLILLPLVAFLLYFAIESPQIDSAFAIDVGTLPFDVAINSITNKAYVAHVDGTVHVIDVNPLNATGP
ncbi:MAG: hypothetical protein QQN50_04300, partial [Nitrosopumilus sp.]